LAKEIRHEDETAPRILLAALGEISPEGPAVLLADGREGGERVVPAIVTGDDRKAQIRLSRQRPEPVEAIGPVAGAAHHAHDDQARTRDRAVEIEVDRKR